MTENQPILTIVIPVRNRAELVGRTLRSVAVQTLRPLDVVLVDNGSTDDTRSVLERWAAEVRTADLNIRILDEPQAGAARARNTGLAAVRTPWTMFFDSDDTMLPDHAGRAVAAIVANPRVDIVGWDVSLHALDGSKRMLRFDIRDIRRTNLLNGSFATLRYCARTELFRRAGGWNERLGVWDDIELGQRLLALSPVIVKATGTPTVQVYETAESISGTHDSLRYDGCLLALECIEPYCSPRAIVGLKKAILAGDCSHVGDQRGQNLIKDILTNEPWLRNRLLMRAAYTIKRHGLRGCGRLFYRLLR